MYMAAELSIKKTYDKTGIWTRENKYVNGYVAG